MPRWLADMARQADRISREMQPAVEMARSMEPHIAQATEAAATMAPAFDLVQRQRTGMTAVLDAVRRYATTDLAHQMRAETDEAVAKMLLDVQANDVEAAAEEILADPGATEVIDQASAQLRAAGAGKLPPRIVFLIVLMWLAVTAGVTAAGMPKEVSPEVDAEIASGAALVGLALIIQWRISDHYKHQP
jgi:hypothetical protein